LYILFIFSNLAEVNKNGYAMSKAVFKSCNQGQTSLFPASLEEKVPEDSPARLINQIVDSLDITKVIDTYKGGGTSSYHPRMMLKVVLFAYLNNIYSCRKIEGCCLC
jgi:transposase